MRYDFTRPDQAAQACGCEILIEEPMRLHTTFKIGGPAERFYSVTALSQLQRVLKALEEENIPAFILGNGSNLLVSDNGISGAVIYLAGEFREIRDLGGGRLSAGAGASLASVCAYARDRSLSGLEFAWGIPGYMGGAAYMNAGAYGGEMKDIISRVIARNEQGEITAYSGKELDFGYRKSRFTGSREVILSVELQLAPGNPLEISGKMEELMGRRKEKQPYDMPSAGSVFKRPEGAFAGALIEKCGLKGTAVGGAQVSEKHSGFIVNSGGATCEDVRQLILLIQNKVLQETGYRLECEVRITGEE